LFVCDGGADGELPANEFVKSCTVLLHEFTGNICSLLDVCCIDEQAGIYMIIAGERIGLINITMNFPLSVPHKGGHGFGEQQWNVKMVRASVLMTDMIGNYAALFRSLVNAQLLFSNCINNISTIITTCESLFELNGFMSIPYFRMARFDSKHVLIVCLSGAICLVDISKLLCITAFRLAESATPEKWHYYEAAQLLVICASTEDYILCLNIHNNVLRVRKVLFCSGRGTSAPDIMIPISQRPGMYHYVRAHRRQNNSLCHPWVATVGHLIVSVVPRTRCTSNHIRAHQGQVSTVYSEQCSYVNPAGIYIESMYNENIICAGVVYRLARQATLVYRMTTKPDPRAPDV